MKNQDTSDLMKVQALMESFLKRPHKDRLDSAIEKAIGAQELAASVHDALPALTIARRRAAEAYLIARGTVAIVATKWLYEFADEEIRPFTANSALLCEFSERIIACKTRDEGARCVEQILNNCRQILDEPDLRVANRQDAA
ncbi:MAG: hypothetical protein P4L53_14355 [Candidatus Obscuribacterales bacterium]|nr:hypothetical protein [Candidatus Obscuribacterales bacterium]